MCHSMCWRKLWKALCESESLVCHCHSGSITGRGRNSPFIIYLGSKTTLTFKKHWLKPMVHVLPYFPTIHLSFNNHTAICTLSILTIPRYCHAFTLARFNVLPSALLTGRYNSVPSNRRFCPCSVNLTETLVHVFFCCRFYVQACLALLEPVLVDKKTCSLSKILSKSHWQGLTK